MKAKIELFGGPRDGEIMTTDVIDHPAQLPVYVHTVKKRRYVYQARRFPTDDLDIPGIDFDELPPVPMYFVQILFPGDEL